LYSGSPPSWISGDVILLHPVIHLNGPNIVLDFDLKWFRSFRTSCGRQTHMQWRLARQTHQQRLKPRAMGTTESVELHRCSRTVVPLSSSSA